MRKALIVALCFVCCAALLAGSTLATETTDLSFLNLFQTLFDLGDKAVPDHDGERVKVQLSTTQTDTPLYPGASATLTHTVTNTGTQDVYFRLYYALPNIPETNELVKVEFTANGFQVSEWMEKDDLRIAVLTYNNALQANEESAVSVTVTVGFDINMTSEQFARYDANFLQTQVLAIETAAFAEKYKIAADALNAALPLDTTNPFAQNEQ